MSGIFDQVINYAPPSLLLGTVTYKGTWSADTNTPTLINPPDSTTNGHYYVVSAAGTQFSLSFNIGDWIISNGSAWEKVDNTDAVSSVFGRTGAVVGVSTDYSAVGITATAVGASSPSTGAFTTLSATTPLAATSGGTGLSSLGTGVATFLGTPTSANLAAAVTNETGSGSLVFGTSPTITTPVIAQINDANGNETLKLASIASAVNEVTIENAATGNAVHISATGGDASVGLHLAGKGASGYVNVQDSTDATKRIMFNAAGGTTNTRTMLSSTQTVDRTISLPDATDTLVGKATTDTLTNKTLTSPTITGGALNGTLGATTPSTVAATTLNATGAVSGNVIATIRNTDAAGYGLSLRNGSDTNYALGIANAAGTITAWQIRGDGTAVASNGSTLFQVTSTGLNSTAIGATTPSTVAATTLNVSTLAGIGVSPHASIPLYVFRNNTNPVARFAADGASGRPIVQLFYDRDGGTTLPVDGTVLGRLDFGSMTAVATEQTTVGRVSVLAAGTWSSVSAPTKFVVELTAVGSLSNATVLSANSSGLAVTGTLSSTAASNIFTFVNSTSGSATNKISFGVTTNEYSFINYSDTTGYLSIGQPSGRSYGVNIQTNGANVGVFTATGLAVTGALSCTGALSKGSGSFRIEHPLPSKSATHQLVHSFIEGPKCDLIYRGKINLVDGKATVNIDTDSTMTEGTFEALCANVQCFTSNESGWGAIRGAVVGNILTIEAQDAASTDNVSWMVIGERKDPHIMDTDWTDENGRPIVEPLKPAVAALESK